MKSQYNPQIFFRFIEESNNNINIIERGLYQVQTTISDSKKISEVLRAAHSIKGGAAMLDIPSIRYVSQELENVFKIFQTKQIKSNKEIESLLWEGFNFLVLLVDEFQGTFGISEDKFQDKFQEIESLFLTLNNHLNNLNYSSEDLKLGIGKNIPLKSKKNRLCKSIFAAIRKILHQLPKFLKM